MKIRYCDGASFSGNPESEFKVSLLEFTSSFLKRCLKDMIGVVRMYGEGNEFPVQLCPRMGLNFSSEVRLSGTH